MAGHAMLRAMGGEFAAFNRAEAASLIGWWLDAGVDMAIAETPRNWLKPSVPRTSATQDAATLENSDRPAPAAKAATLEAFHAWMKQTSDLPLFHASVPRVLPHGPANAAIMLISDLPDRQHAQEGRPIGGEAWQLTVRMLAAIGLKPDEAYVASLSCFPAPGQRLESAVLERCAAIMREHIELVAPKRLLLLGDGPARALTGQPAIQARGRIHRIGGIPTVATIHPRLLLERPQDKSHAWRDLLLLMSEEVS